MNESWLAPGFAPGRLAATIGLISDTHLPERRRTLPPALHAIFEGVDLLLHAGDVGELRVLDELGEIAVVVAVHGNDDTLAARLSKLPATAWRTAAGRVSKIELPGLIC